MTLMRTVTVSCLLGLCAGNFAVPAFSAPPCDTTVVIRQTGKAPSRKPPDYVERALGKYSTAQLLKKARRPAGFNSVITHNIYQIIMKRGDATADVYLDLGMLYLSYGKFDSAVEILDEGLKKSPPQGETCQELRAHSRGCEKSPTNADQGQRRIV